MTDLPDMSAPAREGAPRSPLRHFASHLRVWIPALLGLALDLWSKDWAFEHVHDEMKILPGILSFQLRLNSGALFGLGAGLAPVFVGASALALMFVLYLFSQSTIRQRALHLALGLILAGAIGNLYDRTQVMATFVVTSSGYEDSGSVTATAADGSWIKLGDYMTGQRPRTYVVSNLRSGPQLRPVVRDFIHIVARIRGYPVWPWIFNVADVLLVVGVAILLLHFWIDRRRRPEHPLPAT